MMVIVFIAAIVASIVFIGSNPVPSKYRIEKTKPLGLVKFYPLDEDGNPLGGSINIGVAEVTVRIVHNVSRWRRWWWSL